MPIAAAGMAVAGSLMQGVQGMQQGNYQAAIAKQNAAMETDAARESLVQSDSEKVQFFRQVGQTKGAQIASMAANGIDVGSGSALLTEQDTATAAQGDAANLYKNEYERTRGHVINASNYVEQARAAKAQGQNAMINSVFTAASSAMGSFAQMKGLQAKMNPSGGGSIPPGFGPH